MPFQLSLIVDNSGEPFISEQFVALQVGTNFFFWPSWGPELDSGLGIYNSGRNETTLLAFQWPDIEGRASGLTFHTVLCNPSTRQVISNLDSISFGYE